MITRPSISEDFPKQSLRAPQSRLALLGEARAVLSRSSWNELQQQRLTSACRDLLQRLRRTCPTLNVGRVLNAGEVGGDVPIERTDLQALFTAAAGSKETPQVVWSDGTNELLVEIARISVKTADGRVQVSIPVACEQTARQIVLVTFATGSPDQPAGLLFATDTIPEGPPAIVEIWGEALIALAWTSMLRALSALAATAGTDREGAGLIPAGLAADAQGVTVLVMARHAMDRVTR